MFSEYQNLAVDCWLHSGPRLGIAERALCLRAEPEAIQRLAVIIDEIAKLNVPVQRALTLVPTSRPTGCTTIRIRLLPQSDGLREMSATCQGEVATFEFTASGLQRFREALDRWHGGAEDFSVHPRINRGKTRSLPTKDQQSAEIWFWRRMEP